MAGGAGSNGMATANGPHPLGPNEALKAARLAILDAIPHGGDRMVRDVVADVLRAHPDFGDQEIRTGVWTLLAGGELALTSGPSLRRA
jgi:hypothetical protein